MVRSARASTAVPSGCITSGGQTRALRTSEVVPVLDAAIDVSIHTTCPRKWAFVDLETGEVWKHDGQAFIRASTDEVKSITRALGGC